MHQHFFTKTNITMADAPHFKSIGEKFEAITAGKRPNSTLIWVTNQAMNNLPAHHGNPVLVQVTAKQFARPNNPYLKQGYSKYVHVKPAPAPVEAKPESKAEAKPALTTKSQ